MTVIALTLQETKVDLLVVFCICLNVMNFSNVGILLFVLLWDAFFDLGMMKGKQGALWGDGDLNIYIYMYASRLKDVLLCHSLSTCLVTCL